MVRSLLGRSAGGGDVGPGGPDPAGDPQLVVLPELGAVVALALLLLAAATVRRRQRPAVGDGESPSGSPSEDSALLGDAEGSRARRHDGKGLAFSIRPNAVVGGLFMLSSVLLLSDFMWNNRLQAMREAAGARNQNPEYTCQPLSPEARLRHFGTLEGYSHKISTSSADVQRHFDQGLVNLYNFNQVEAAKSFRIALSIDQNCAMCHWGLAYSYGPFVNKVEHAAAPAFPYPTYGQEAHAAASAAASDALRIAKVKTNLPSAEFAIELAYVEALHLRFGPEALPGAGYKQAEAAYADSMEALGRAKTDIDALALAAEALLNPIAWDYYEDGVGTMKPAAARAEGLLIDVLQASPSHPLALHLMVHLKEQLPAGYGHGKASEGEAAGQKLVTAQPAMGHLVHMSAHIFLRVGRYGDGVDASVAAVKRDMYDSMACLIPYGPEHNLDMLIAHASLAGQYGVAVQYSELLRKFTDEGQMNPYAKFPGRSWTTLYMLQTRYAMWSAVLQSAPPRPGDRGQSPYLGYEYATTMWHFGRFLAKAARISDTRGIMLASRAADSEAIADIQAEAEAFRAAAAGTDDSDVLALPAARWRAGPKVGLYSGAYALQAQIATRMVNARLAALEGNLTVAAEELREAASVQNQMEYMEPPKFFQSVLPCLGKVLLDAGDYTGATDAFLEDLDEFPENAWSLFGLGHSLAGQGLKPESQAAFKRHKHAWQRADTAVETMRSSCPCMAGTFRPPAKD